VEKYQSSMISGSLRPTHGDERHLSARIAAPTETLYADDDATRFGSYALVSPRRIPLVTCAMP
jgi:hypothetical protein